MVVVYLGDMPTEEIHVGIYADPMPNLGQGERPEHGRALMDLKEHLAGAMNERTEVPADRPAGDFTPRIVPYHPQAFIHMKYAHTLWLC